jgi:hypothetical protein
MITYKNKVMFINSTIVMLITLAGMLIISKYRETYMAIPIFMLTFFVVFFIAVFSVFFAVYLVQIKEKKVKE